MGVPNMPGRRRAMPKPFQRPSINVSGGEVKREWREAKIKDLEVGDIVASKGAVTKLTWLNKGGKIELVTGDDNTTREYLTDDTVLAFTKVR